MHSLDPRTLYLVLNYGILAPWALLVFAPRARITTVLVHRGTIPIALCLTHGALFLFVSAAGHMPEGGGGASLDAVMRMFGSPWAALLCWVHYLAFDLLVGAWQVRDATARGVPRAALVPCTLLTLFFGPVGMLVYALVRSTLRPRAATGELVS